MITIYDWFGYTLTLRERYRLIKKAGFDGVLLWWSNGFGRDSLGWDDYRNGPRIAREEGLFVENIHTPVQDQDNLWLDNLDGEALTECYLQCISDCAELEIPTMVVHLPGDDHPYHAPGMDRFKRIAEKAERLNVNVALENLRNLTNLTYVLDHVDSNRIGFCYDCGHHYRYYPEYDLLSAYGYRLKALHLHDNGGIHNQHRLPFDGDINWLEAMKHISKTNYSGPTAIEAMNWDYQDLSAEEFLHKAFERAKRLEALRMFTES